MHAQQTPSSSSRTRHPGRAPAGGTESVVTQVEPSTSPGQVEEAGRVHSPVRSPGRAGSCRRVALHGSDCPGGSRPALRIVSVSAYSLAARKLRGKGCTATRRPIVAGSDADQVEPPRRYRRDPGRRGGLFGQPLELLTQPSWRRATLPGHSRPRPRRSDVPGARAVARARHGTESRSAAYHRQVSRRPAAR